MHVSMCIRDSPCVAPCVAPHGEKSDITSSSHEHAEDFDQLAELTMQDVHLTVDSRHVGGARNLQGIMLGLCCPGTGATLSSVTPNAYVNGLCYTYNCPDLGLSPTCIIAKFKKLVSRHRER